MKYSIILSLIIILLTSILTKKLKHTKNYANQMRFKSTHHLRQDNINDEMHNEQALENFQENSRGEPPREMIRDEHAPDIPDEMPEYLEKELDMLKDNDSYGVSQG